MAKDSAGAPSMIFYNWNDKETNDPDAASDWWLRNTIITVNGDRQRHVVEAIVGLNGTIEKLAMDEKGMPYVNESGNEIRMEFLYGNVVVEFKEPYCP